MYYNPIKNVGLETYKVPKGSNPSDFIWDIHAQKLVILKWPFDKETYNIKIVPGIRNYK
jgi:hypothetical protein